MKELDRLQVLTRIAERRLTRRRAAGLLQIGERQVRRLYRAFVQDGAAGLVSRRRGRPSPRRLPAATQERALALIRERYADFGPTFAHQKLTEEHALVLSVETLRGWMIAAGLWISRLQRARRSYPPRPRRACLGELVQLDGSEHAWFEDRGPVCTLLVYVDDATSRPMELSFAAVESTLHHFRPTPRYPPNQPPADGALQAGYVRPRGQRRDPPSARGDRRGERSRGRHRHHSRQRPGAPRPPLPQGSRAARSRRGRRLPPSRRGLRVDRGATAGARCGAPRQPEDQRTREAADPRRLCPANPGALTGVSGHLYFAEKR